MSQTFTQCRATYDDLGYRCEDEQGHAGMHYFTSTVEWEGCWSCRRQPDEEHEQGYCEAVIEALDLWAEAFDIPAGATS